MKAAYRLASNNDLPGIYEIEKVSFITPWMYDSLLYDVCENPNSLYLVAESDNKIVGFCGVHIVLDECHINNVAVLPQFRCLSVGQGLISSMLTMTQETISKYSLEVRENNKSAIRLYEKFGFIGIGYRQNYYPDTNENAIIMCKDQSF